MIKLERERGTIMCFFFRNILNVFFCIGIKLQTISPLTKLIQEMRMIKSPSEIEVMKKSGIISSKAFVEAMKWTKPGTTESQLWAKFDYETRVRGSSILAYVPVIAGGPNALSMHYVRNDMPLK